MLDRFVAGGILVNISLLVTRLLLRKIYHATGLLQQRAETYDELNDGVEVWNMFIVVW